MSAVSEKPAEPMHLKIKDELYFKNLNRFKQGYYRGNEKDISSESCLRIDEG
jgi:hypothetical protein